MVLDDGSERAASRMCHLLKSLSDAVIITPQQMSQVSLLKSFSDAIIITQQQMSPVY